MKNKKSILYISPIVEIINVKCNDIVTTSSMIPPEDNPSITPPDITPPGGYVADDNFLGTW